MVLPASAPDDPSRPEDQARSWLDELSHILRLARRGVMVLIDGAEPSQLSALVRHLLTIDTSLGVSADAAAIARSPEGALLVLAPQVHQIDWLNLNRPLLSYRKLQVVLFCSHVMSAKLATGAPDFFHWISHRIECPPAAPRPAVAGIRYASWTRAKYLNWGGGDLRRAFELALPGRDLIEVDANQSPQALDDATRAAGRGWIAWTRTFGERQARQLRDACVLAGRRGRNIICDAQKEMPWSWPVHALSLSLPDAERMLQAAGARNPGRLAAFLALEPEAIEVAAALLRSGVDEAELETSCLTDSDPGAGIMERAMAGDLLARMPNPVWLRALARRDRKDARVCIEQFTRRAARSIVGLFDEFGTTRERIGLSEDETPAMRRLLDFFLRDMARARRPVLCIGSAWPEESAAPVVSTGDDGEHGEPQTISDFDEVLHAAAQLAAAGAISDIVALDDGSSVQRALNENAVGYTLMAYAPNMVLLPASEAPFSSTGGKRVRVVHGFDEAADSDPLSGLLHTTLNGRAILWLAVDPADERLQEALTNASPEGLRAREGNLMLCRQTDGPDIASTGRGDIERLRAANIHTTLVEEPAVLLGESASKLAGLRATPQLPARRRGEASPEDLAVSPHNIRADIETGRRLFDAGQYDEAAKRLIRASEWLQQRGRVREGLALLTPFQPDTARSMLQPELVGRLMRAQGAAYFLLAAMNEAIACYQQALAIARDIEDQRGEGGCLGNLGLIYAELGQPDKAIQHHEQALAIARDIGDQRGEGRCLGNLGLVYADLSQLNKAIQYHMQALVIARDIGDKRGEGIRLGNLGVAYSALGQFDKAIQHHEQALAIARDLGDRRGEGSEFGNIGAVYTGLGQFDNAIQHHEQALVIARDIGDKRIEGKSLGSLGLIYTYLGQFDNAIQRYEQALALARDIGNKRDEGIHIGNLGFACAELGQFDNAIQHYEQALALARELGNKHGEGTVLGNLGVIYAELGQFDNAIQHYEQALALARGVGDRRGEGSQFGNLGTVFARFGQLDEAIQHYEQALSIACDIGDKRIEGIFSGDLGLAYAGLGQLDKAIQYYEQALSIARDIGDKRGEGNQLGNLGIAYKNLGQRNKAISLLEEALALGRTIHSPHNVRTFTDVLTELRES